MNLVLFVEIFVALIAVAALIAFGLGLLRRMAEIRQSIGDLTQAIQPAVSAQAESSEADLINLRLQACERFTLMLERIAVPNLLLRTPPPEGATPAEYLALLLLSIRQEFEYNVTQQIYVSDSLWQIITQARDNVSLLVSRAAEGAENAPQIANRMRYMSDRQPDDPIALAQGACRREAASVLTE